MVSKPIDQVNLLTAKKEAKEASTQTGVIQCPERLHFPMDEIPKGSHQFYVPVFIGDMALHMLVDSGSSLTVIDIKTFNCVDKESKGKLCDSTHSCKNASNQVVYIAGECILTLDFNQHR